MSVQKKTSKAAKSKEAQSKLKPKTRAKSKLTPKKPAKPKANPLAPLPGPNQVVDTGVVDNAKKIASSSAPSPATGKPSSTNESPSGSRPSTTLSA